ncbi:hypothetical protein IEO21_07539 [Rhodonia placenta]|uniref:Uncharacterized protein n=1 Tax=Rhodonia placenta TaxID=104341 RepID=A0A8H7NXU1_9APHY|nr:hypothetical protein IEO21_07539 [Postia placenta]
MAGAARDARSAHRRNLELATSNEGLADVDNVCV